MGQRLVINICDGEEKLANCYYHWSAYTDSALDLSNKIVESIMKNKDKIFSKKALAVNALYETGAGIESGDREEFMLEKMKDFKFDIPYMQGDNRNAGLIAISEDNMQESEEAGEGFVNINLEKQFVDFTVFYENDEDTDEEEQEDEETTQINFSVTELIPFKNFHKFSKEIQDAGFYFTDITGAKLCKIM